MTWILSQDGATLVRATAVRLKECDDSVEAPPRYKIVAYHGDATWFTVGEYPSARKAREAFQALVDDVKSGAWFVVVRGGDEA